MRRVAQWVVGCTLGLWGAGVQAQTPTEPPLTLAAATQLALTTNPTMTAARSLVAQAEARRAQAQAQLRSQITLNSAFGVSSASVIAGPPDYQNFHELVNTISIPLNIGKKPRLAVKQAESQLSESEAQWKASQLALAAQVSAAYFDLLRKQALRKLAQDTEAVAKRQLSEAEKRFRAGDVAELDVLRARVPVATAEAGIVQAESSVTIAQQTLNALLGRPLEQAVDVADGTEQTNDAIPSLTAEEAQKQAVTNSPDVQAAEAAVHTAELMVQLAHRSRDPEYALQATDTRSNDQTGFSRVDGINASVTLPLTGGGIAKAQIKEAEAALLQARSQLLVARQNVTLTVTTAYRNAKASQRQITAARTAAEVAQVAYDKALRGYQAGLFSLTDTLSAQSALTQARLATIQAVYDAAAAQAVLQNALGEIPR